MQASNSDSESYKFISSFNYCRINKGISNFLKQTVAMHRWEETLAKHRVLSVTCDHYDNHQLTLLTFTLKTGFSSCIKQCFFDFTLINRF